MDIRCLIVDDEPPAVDELSYILSKVNGVKVASTANSAGKAIKIIKTSRLELVFLDIKMPGKDGFEVIHACSQLKEPPYFVIATAYDEHAVKAFEASAVDYILKPFRPERVRESVERVRNILTTQHQGALFGQLEKIVKYLTPQPGNVTKIAVEKKGRILLLNPEEIVLCKAKNKGIEVYTHRHCYSLSGPATLDDLEVKLNSLGFFRSHRSYLVNLVCIKEMAPWFNGKYVLTTTDDSSMEVPVARTRVKKLKHRLGL